MIGPRASSQNGKITVEASAIITTEMPKVATRKSRWRTNGRVHGAVPLRTRTRR